LCNKKIFVFSKKGLHKRKKVWYDTQAEKRMGL